MEIVWKAGIFGRENEFLKNISGYLVGDAGVEPTAFGSGDQRSIQLS